MARGKIRWTSRCFFSLQITLYLFFILVQGNEETEEAYRNRRSLVLEYFLPINFPPAVEVPIGREKRDLEGSGEEGPMFSEINNKNVDSELRDVEHSTQNAFAKLLTENEQENSFSNFTNFEGSGEVDESNESSYEISSEEDEENNKEITTQTYAVVESEIVPKMVNSSEEEEVKKSEENTTTLTYEVEEPEISLKKVNPVEAAILKEDEIIPSTTSIEKTTPDLTTEGITEMIFDTSQDFSSIEMTSTEKVEATTTTVETETFTMPIQNGESMKNKADIENSTIILEEEISTESTKETTKAQPEESTTSIHKPLASDYFEETSTSTEETTTESQEAASISVRLLDTVISEGDATEAPSTTVVKLRDTVMSESDATETPATISVKLPNTLISEADATETPATISVKLPDTVILENNTTESPSTIGVKLPDTIISGDTTETFTPISTTIKQEETSTAVPIHIPVVTTENLGKQPQQVTPTEGLRVSTKQIPTTPEMVVEEIFKETKIAHKSLEAPPGNILQKENMTLGVDPFPIVTNTRIMDSEETLNSMEPKRLGAYIVVGLILLSFSSLVGYITLKKRKMNRKRKDFESRPENHDTEKALLSLSEYKDSTELEENHLKNNEITPIVVKSNSQINKFEKNTNFSSPKNLNTIANEKNIEKDNVLKSTSENLTQVIIEDSPKDLEEDRNVPCTEKLIVRTRMDQDSIPKKPIIITRSSTGYIPISQDTL